MNPGVKNVKPIKDFKLLLEFYNGKMKIFDVKPYLDRGIFKELKTIELFNSVRVADGSIHWGDEADFCPDTLYLESSEIALTE